MQTPKNGRTGKFGQGFQLGDWLVQPDAGTITRDSESVRLEPKALEVLCYLAERPGELVTREALERDVWKGAVIGYDSVTAAVTKLRKALGDEAANPTYIATVPKRGYRLIVEVDVIDDSEPTAAAESSITDLSGSVRTSIPKAGLIVGVLLVVLLLATLLVQSGRQDHQDRDAGSDGINPVHSIVVVPFTSLGEDPSREMFADGMTDDIITDLSRLSNLRVAASRVSFNLKQREIDPKMLGTELGVEFALMGSIRRMNDDIRINLQLVETATGFQRWAKRYDRRADQVFAVQDEVTASIVEALSVKLSNQEKKRLAHISTNNISAYESFLEGQRLTMVNTKEAAQQAKERYARAVELDPKYGRPYGAMAFLEGRNYLLGWSEAPMASLDRALELARTGVRLDSTIPHTHWSLGYAHLMRKEYEAALESTKLAVEIAPNFADGYGLLALISNNLGKPEQALQYIAKGKELNPFFSWDYLYNEGRAYYFLGRFEEASRALESALNRNENASQARLYLVASYVRLGRLDDAEWEVEQLLMVSPSTTRSLIKHTLPIKDPVQRDTFFGDLQKAGLPD